MNDTNIVYTGDFNAAIVIDKALGVHNVCIIHSIKPPFSSKKDS